MRTARPAGVRYSNQPIAGTSSRASRVSAVWVFRMGMGSQSMGANGVTVGGVLTLGKLTR